MATKTKKTVTVDVTVNVADITRYVGRLIVMLVLILA